MRQCIAKRTITTYDPYYGTINREPGILTVGNVVVLRVYCFKKNTEDFGVGLGQVIDIQDEYYEKDVRAPMKVTLDFFKKNFMEV